VLFCRAALPLSRQMLAYASGVIRRHRARIGSCWRKLSPGRQALLVLAYLRKGETFADLAAGFGIGTATAWRYVTETVALLAARAGVAGQDRLPICSQNRTPESREARPSCGPGLLTCGFYGVSEGIRTPDIQDHNLAL
jgi:hypothetical protein